MATFTPATWDPLKKGDGVTLSNANKTATSTSYSVLSTVGVDGGKWYMEYTYASGSDQFAGLANELFLTDGVPGASANSIALLRSSGEIYVNGTSVATFATGGTTISMLIDADANKLQFRRNGVDVGPEITLSGSVFYAVFGNTGKCTLNCGATAFTYTVPAGYFAGFGARAFEISGNVKDAAGDNVARQVRAHRRMNGKLAASGTSNASTGNYTLSTPYEGEHTLTFLDDDAGTAYNALVLDRVTGI